MTKKPFKLIVFATPGAARMFSDTLVPDPPTPVFSPGAILVPWTSVPVADGSPHPASNFRPLNGTRIHYPVRVRSGVVKAPQSGTTLAFANKYSQLKNNGQGGQGGQCDF